MKVCNKCKISKPLLEYSKGADKRDGLGRFCNPCLYLCGKKYKQSKKGKATAKRYNKIYNSIPKNRERLSLRALNRMHIGRSWEHLSDVTVDYLLELRQSTKECILCGCILNEENKKHIDHILPISKGGLHMKDNIRIICANCNLTRAD